MIEIYSLQKIHTSRLSDLILKVYTFLFAKNFIITLHDHASFI